MTLQEMSAVYAESARLLKERIATLRAMRRVADPEERWYLDRRIAELKPMLTQMNELKDLTEHYYDKGYWRSEKYCL